MGAVAGSFYSLTAFCSVYQSVKNHQGHDFGFDVENVMALIKQHFSATYNEKMENLRNLNQALTQVRDLSPEEEACLQWMETRSNSEKKNLCNHEKTKKDEQTVSIVRFLSAAYQAKRAVQKLLATMSQETKAPFSANALFAPDHQSVISCKPEIKTTSLESKA
ncbi:MAG: hypothetical protein AAGI90_00865 [Chlamydiota bacterium]